MKTNYSDTKDILITYNAPTMMKINCMLKQIGRYSVRIGIFILLTFIAPIIALPFTKGPRIAILTPVALTVGIILLGINFIIKILAQKEIGIASALKSKGSLVTRGVYGTVRNPLYMSNFLLAVGMAVLLKSMYALLFSIPYALLYLRCN